MTLVQFLALLVFPVMGIAIGYYVSHHSPTGK